MLWIIVANTLWRIYMIWEVHLLYWNTFGRMVWSMVTVWQLPARPWQRIWLKLMDWRRVKIFCVHCRIQLNQQAIWLFYVVILRRRQVYFLMWWAIYRKSSQRVHMDIGCCCQNYWQRRSVLYWYSTCLWWGRWDFPSFRRKQNSKGFRSRGALPGSKGWSRNARGKAKLGMHCSTKFALTHTDFRVDV